MTFGLVAHGLGFSLFSRWLAIKKLLLHSASARGGIFAGIVKPASYRFISLINANKFPSLSRKNVIHKS
jgi:hypothetical protein